MAYNPFSDAQVGDYLKQHNLSAADPWALYNHARQNDADPMQVARVAGIDATAAQNFLSAAPGVLTGQIQGQAQLAQTNPQQAYAAAQARGYSPQVAEQIFGAGSGAAAPWAQSQGLTGFGAPAAGASPFLQIGGTPTPANMSPASPGGWAGVGPGLTDAMKSTGWTGASTTGSTPATMPAHGPGNGAVGVPDYMVAAPGGQGAQRNPYLPGGGVAPAGGPSRGGDPRTGGPANWGGARPAMGGLMGYLSENPHMLAMGNEMTRRVNNNLTRNTLPAIRRNAMVDGVSGGSGQGIAEGLAIGETNAGLAGALAGLYGNQFNTDRGFGLQNDALDFQVHQGNQQTMRQGQVDTLDFLDRMTNWGQQGIGAATQARDQPFTDWNRFVGPASQMAGLGGQSTQQLQGNPWLGAMGGYMTGSRMFGGG